MLDVSAELDRQSYKPLYIQLAEIIIEYANTHHLENGEALPSENELLSHFSVSRNTIRLAVDRLVQLGVAKKVRGQGTFLIKKKRALSVQYHYAFTGSVERMGLKVTNKLIDKTIVPNRVHWLDGLGSTNWDETVWIRRTKWASEELLAVDERLLPGSVVKRYSQKEIENFTKEEHLDLFTHFISGVVNDYGNYLNKDNIDLYRDGVGYSQAILYLSDEEFLEMSTQLRDLFMKYQINEPTSERKKRKFTTIIMPDEQKE